VAPVVAENDTVSVQVGLQGLLLKVAMTPVGRLDAEKLRGAVVPETSVMVKEAVGLVLPWATVRPLGEGTDMLKSNVFGWLTVKRAVVE